MSDILKHRYGSIATAIAIFFAISGAAAADAIDVTEKDVMAFSPRADVRLVKALVDNRQAIEDAEITTRLRLAHFLAQVATETGGLRRLDENLNYSERALLRTFSRGRVPFDKAKELAATNPREVKERAIANWLYGNILGNQGRHTDDGWTYRGSGFIQLTGRGNFRERGSEVGLPLEEQPDLARQAREGLLAALAYWKARDINDAADDDDVQRVRVLINGPRAHGLELTRLFLARSRAVLLAGAGAESRETATLTSETDAIAGVLEELGFLQPGARESTAAEGDVVSEALRAYQQSEGLPETGRLDLDTFYSIADQPGLRGDPLELASVPPIDPNAGVGFDVVSQETTTSAGASGLGPPAAVEGREGTGATVADTNLVPDELFKFANSAATYSAYEVEAGRRDAGGNFVPFSVIEPDERKPVVNTTAYPARAIAQIFFSVGGADSHLCTGALISPDTVLTAAHCVHEGRPGGAWYQRFAVYPGRNGGAKPFGSCGVRKVYALSGWVNAADPLEGRYYDLGALKLDCDVGRRTGWLGVRALGQSEVGLMVTVEGYPGDKTPAGRQWMSTGPLRTIEGRKAFHQIDTYGGMSGSPVLPAGGNTIVAVHTNGLHGGEPWRSNNAATLITSERLAIIWGWTEDQGE